MRHERRRSLEALVVARVCRLGQIVEGHPDIPFATENLEQCVEITVADCLVERDAHRLLVHQSDVDSAFRRTLQRLNWIVVAELDSNRVEVILVRDGVAESLQTFREYRRVSVNSRRNSTQSPRSMPDRVHARDDREQ